jgi:hypothetical protein
MKHLYLTLLLLVVAITGCGSGVQYLPVTGTLTVDGVPMEGVTLSFIPTSGGITASATTNAQGEFSITTSNHNGCIPGEYAVVVFKRMFLFSSAQFSSDASKRSVLPQVYPVKNNYFLFFTIFFGTL